VEGVCGLPKHTKDLMRVFRHYHCDYGHQWTVQRQHTEDEQASDLICTEGDPAITGRVELPVDDVQILISPAARVVDQLRRQRILEGRYYLSLLDKNGKRCIQGTLQLGCGRETLRLLHR
jgi:hypothetical protein